MTCDHTASKASLDAFFAGTRLIGAMTDGDNGWLILGCCKGCDSTLAMPVQEVRASVAAHGEIDMAAMERDASELLRRSDR